jgi:hypothetical protein
MPCAVAVYVPAVYRAAASELAASELAATVLLALLQAVSAPTAARPKALAAVLRMKLRREIFFMICVSFCSFSIVWIDHIRLREMAARLLLSIYLSRKKWK